MQQQTRKSAPAAQFGTPGPSFIVGQNRFGQWLAIENDGSGGGIFCSKEAAMRYAAAESDRRPQAIRLAGDLIELRF